MYTVFPIAVVFFSANNTNYLLVNIDFSIVAIIFQACEAGHCDIITILCNHVSDPLGSMNQSNNRGQTPLGLLKTSSCEGNRKAIEIVQKYSVNHDD